MGPTEATRIGRILEEAAQVYTREGVGVWLLGRNKALRGSRPLDLIKRGELDRLQGHVRSLAEGVSV